MMTLPFTFINQSDSIIIPIDMCTSGLKTAPVTVTLSQNRKRKKSFPQTPCDLPPPPPPPPPPHRARCVAAVCIILLRCCLTHGNAGRQQAVLYAIVSAPARPQ